MIARNRIHSLYNHLVRHMSSQGHHTDKVLYHSMNNHVLQVVLNNEKALNSLDLDMINSLGAHVDQWNHNPQIKVVLMRGAGKKAFCAGGDVKTLYLAKANNQTEGNKHPQVMDTFFRNEYTVDYKIAKMRPLQVAIWDGIVMGGGVGISIHAPFKIATENSMFAMPEAKIGFFTDVSGGYLLSKLHNNIGLYLGLTSQRVKGKDLVRAGLANYFVPSEKIAELESLLYDNPSGDILTRPGLDGVLRSLGEKVEGDLPNIHFIQQ